MLEGEKSRTQEQLKHHEDQIRQLKAELASVNHGNNVSTSRLSDLKSDENNQNGQNDLVIQSAVQQILHVVVEKVKTTVIDEIRLGQEKEGKTLKRRREEVSPYSQQQEFVSPNDPSTSGSPLEHVRVTPMLIPEARATVDKHATIHDDHSDHSTIYFKSDINDDNVEEVFNAIPLAHPERLSSITSINITGSLSGSRLPSSSANPSPQQAVFTGSTLCCAVRLPALSSLSITGQMITFEGGQSIGRLSSLTSLELSSCRNINSSTLLKMLPGLHKLEHLNLSSTNVKEAGMRVLSQYLSGSLKTLNVTSCEGLTDAAFMHLSSCKRLEKLEAGHLTKISDAGLLHLVELPLKHVMLESSSNVTGAWLLNVASKVMRQLELLDLSNTKVTDNVLQHLAANAEGLKSLWIKSCLNVTQHGLKALSEVGERLDVNSKGCNAAGVILGKVRRSLVKR
ncbi:unnamed protein product [Closterium sp. Yama58-4]|nr:unnamed protein product [Closterium sp. Yama58-4]